MKIEHFYPLVSGETTDLSLVSLVSLWSLQVLFAADVYFIN